MKVQKITQDNAIMKNTPNFNGGTDAVLRYLATNQAVGANCVDLGFMVIPRTGSDLIRRGPLAGAETGRREISGTVNHSLIGVYGAAAGALATLIMGVDKKFGAKANKIMSAPETINILAECKAQNMKSQKDYLKKVLENIEAYNPSSSIADSKGYIKLDRQTIDEIADMLDRAISNNNLDFKKWSQKNTTESLDVIINKFTEKTGAQSKYLLKSAEQKDLVSETNLRTMLEDIYKVSKAFNKEKVVKAFEEQISEGKKVAENKFIKLLTRFGKIKSVAGIAIAAGIGMSIQPVNMYLTKKKTGQDGFVGVEGRTKDKSKSFFALKLASAAAFFSMVLSTINTEKKGIKKISPKGLVKKMAFKGFWPTLSQLKAVYGLTIVSRLFVARDKDELREALTKDTLGFLSWLVLGDFVNKMAAEGLNKKLAKPVMNRTKDIESKGYFERLFKSSLKTRDEILIETLAENGINTVKENNGKIVAKTFKEMMRELDNIPVEAKKLARKRLKALNKAQGAGYAFSGLVLGLGIPNLNIYITNRLDKKRKAKLAEQELNKA